VFSEAQRLNAFLARVKVKGSDKSTQQLELPNVNGTPSIYTAIQFPLNFSHPTFNSVVNCGLWIHS